MTRSGFHDAVLRRLGFLQREHGFTELPQEASPGGEIARFQKGGIEIMVTWGRHELDVAFYALVDTSVLRPGVSKHFPLQTLAPIGADFTGHAESAEELDQETRAELLLMRFTAPVYATGLILLRA